MANAVTKKLADENNISVKKPEVDEVVNRIKKTGGGGDLNQILVLNTQFLLKVLNSQHL